MKTHADITQDKKSKGVSESESQLQSSSEPTLQLVDNRPEAIAQRKLHEMANNSSRALELRSFHNVANSNHQAKPATQLQAMADKSVSQKQQPIQKKENNTGLPDDFKSGIENLSGYSMDDVKVHRNSDKPAQLQAHAFAQGTDIHLGPGQEKHLPHEAWHVVQQKQGRVKPTTQMKGNVQINDDAGLEKEADVMGAKAIQRVGINHTALSNGKGLIQNIIQGDFLDKSEKTNSFTGAETAKNYYRGPFEMWAMSSIKAAIANYEAIEVSEGGININVARQAIQALLGVIQAQRAWAVRFTDIIDHLEMEANLILDDFDYCNDTFPEIETESWRKNPDKISATKKEVLSRLSKYGGLKAVGKADQAINRGVVKALGDLHGNISVAAYALRNDIGADNYEYGGVEEHEETNDVHVEVKPEHLMLLDDFRATQSFLKKKGLVLQMLAPLGEKILELIESGKPLVEAFSEALRFFERPAGFDKEPIVPLGILPADVFIDLLSQGNILDDFGAGLQHGEYSHRLQWVAIIVAQESGKIPLKTSVIEVYQAINLPPFSEGRTGNSMWGMSMDKGTNAVEDTYSAPGTLNKDLMEMAPNFNAETTIGKARWNGGAKPPTEEELGADTYQKLQVIGKALNEVKEMRLALAENSTEEELDTNEWKGYGAPTGTMVEQYEQELIEKQGYSEFDSGEFVKTNPFSSEEAETSPWKVLEKK